jgi:WD40 repeat protein
VSSLAYSPDGKWIAGAAWSHYSRGRKAQLMLWNAAMGAEVWTLPVRPDLFHVAFSPDGQEIATWDAHKIQCRRRETGEVTRTIPDPKKQARTIQYLPNGQFLAATSADGWVRFWRLADGVELAPMKVSDYPILGLAFSPSSRLMAVSSLKTPLRIWSLPGLETVP